MKKKIAASFISAAVTVSAAASFAMSAFAEDGAPTSNAASPQSPSALTMLLPLVIMFVLLYFMMIKPQKKREQEQKAMQESLRVGDEIVTTGGIVGMVVRVGDDNIVIETGGERNKLRIKKWAIAENVSAAERIKDASASKKSALAISGVSDEDEKKSKKSKKNKTDEESEGSEE